MNCSFCNDIATYTIDDTGVNLCDKCRNVFLTAKGNPNVTLKEIPEPLDFATIMDNMRETLNEMDGESVADIYNQVCSRKIEYVEDSIWQYTGKDDNK